MKNILFVVLISASLFSCNSKDGSADENTHKTDSLLKIINSPELAALNKKILDNPEEANLYNERAKIYLQFKQFDEAINDSKRSLRMDSSNASYYLTEADIFFASNETRNAKDVLAMSDIVFGGRDRIEKTPCTISLINCNSPLRWDDRMLDAQFEYSAANQAVLLTPFL